MTLLSILEGFDSVGKKLAAGRAVAVVFFKIGMGCNPVVNVIEESLGGKQGTAAFAALQRMATDHFVTDRNGADIVFILHPDGIGGADIDTGAATDAAAFDRLHEIDALPFVHDQRTWPHDFTTDTDAETTANATVRSRAEIDIPGGRQRAHGFGLGRHLQQVLECLTAGTLDQITCRFYLKPLFDPQHTCQHRCPATALPFNFNRAQTAGPGRLQGRMVAQRRQTDVVATGDFQNSLAFFRFIALAVDRNVDHSNRSFKR